MEVISTWWKSVCQTYGSQYINQGGSQYIKLMEVSSISTRWKSVCQTYGSQYINQVEVSISNLWKSVYQPGGSQYIKLMESTKRVFAHKVPNRF